MSAIRDKALCEAFSNCGCQLIERLLPKIVLIPESFDAIADLVQLCAQERIRLCLMGTGSSFPANYSPPDDTVFVMMNQMNQLLDLKLLDAVVIVETGILTSRLAKLLEGTDLEFPSCLADYGGTIGGAILSRDNSRLRHAEIRRRLLGVRLIDPKGRLLRFGTASIKNVAGYDFWSFLIGTEGRFGIMVEVIFNVEKMPPIDITSNLVPNDVPVDDPGQWIYANLCKGLDPDGIFVR